MDIDNGLKYLESLDIDSSSVLISKIKEVASAIPETVSVPSIEERDELSSQLLMSRLLRDFGNEIGVNFTHTDVIESAYKPTIEKQYEELLNKVNHVRQKNGWLFSESAEEKFR